MRTGASHEVGCYVVDDVDGAIPGLRRGDGHMTRRGYHRLPKITDKTEVGLLGLLRDRAPGHSAVRPG